MQVHKYEEAETINDCEKTQILKDWSQNVGIEFSNKLKYPVRFVSNLIGVQTCESLLSSELLVSVPNHAIISSKLSSAQLDEIYDSHLNLFGKKCKEHEEYRLVAFLL